MPPITLRLDTTSLQTEVLELLQKTSQQMAIASQTLEPQGLQPKYQDL